MENIVFQVILSGISTGSLYGLVGLGLIMIFKATDVLNFAIGEQMMVSAFFAWMLSTIYKIPYYQVFILTIIFSGFLGAVLQMLAIGRALMGKPKLLLLDEPSMGLAPLIVDEIFHRIRVINRESTTVLLVEQNAIAALEIAAKGFIIENGTISLSGTGQELLDNEKVKQAYMGG